MAGNSGGFTMGPSTAPPFDPQGFGIEPVSGDRPGVGQLLSGRYRLIERLGAGAMGEVFRAEHTMIEKAVAIKVLNAEMGANAEAVERFRREAQAAAHIDHPNVCAATDFGLAGDGSFFLVMEYLEGADLAVVIERERRLAPERAVFICRQICGALARSHGMGIVHRDMKPENVMLVSRDGIDDFVKVLDFGIAKTEPAPTSAGGEVEKLTMMGTALGTPSYMAPEQAVGERVDSRADLYALGVMLFEMLTGERPFTGGDAQEVMIKHLTEAPPAMRDVAKRAKIPEALEAIVARLLAKEPDARFRSAADLDAALAEVFADAPSSGVPDVQTQRVGVITNLPKRSRKAGRPKKAKKAKKPAARAAPKAGKSGGKPLKIVLLAAAALLVCGVAATAVFMPSAQLGEGLQVALSAVGVQVDQPSASSEPGDSDETGAPAAGGSHVPIDWATPPPIEQDPRGLEITEHVVATKVANRTPKGVSASFDKAEAESIYCYIQAKNPRGPKREITVVWYRNGAEIARYPLKVGRSVAWRTWAKLRLSDQRAGSWRCDAVNETGKRLSTAEFEVVE